jgi:lipoprotein-releasing system permease protein
MSLISVAGLAFGVSLLIVVLSVMNGFEREVRENVLGIIPHLTVSSEQDLSTEQWDRLGAALLAENDVISLSRVVTSLGVVATPTASRAIALNGVDVESDSFAKLSKYAVSGSLDRLAESRWRVVVGATLARDLGVEVGDSIDVFSPKLTPNPLVTMPTFKSFEIAAITRVGSEALDAKLITLTLADARALLRMRATQSAFTLVTQDVLVADRVRNRLSSKFGDAIVIESWTATLGAIYRNIQFSRSIISFMLWLLIAIAAFNLVVSLVMIVRDKRDDVAILMTLGANTQTVQAIFIWQGAAIALLGIAAGVVLGILGALWIGEIASAFEAVTGVVLLNPEIYPIDFLPSQILASDIAGIAGGVLILSVLASLYPARQAASLRPASVLRGD